MSDNNSQSLQQEARRHLIVFGAVAVGTLAIVLSSLAPLTAGLKIALVLAIALVQASLVAGFLMHLISEKRMILSSLVLTAILFVALLFLPILSEADHTHRFFLH
jgi:caa(3)-type oxidase subunit IV